MDNYRVYPLTKGDCYSLIKPIGGRLYVQTKMLNDSINVKGTEIFMDTDGDRGKHSATHGTVIAKCDSVTDIEIGDIVFFSYVLPINAIDHFEVFEEDRFFLHNQDVDLVMRDGKIVARDGKLIVGFDSAYIAPPKDMVFPEGFWLPPSVKPDNRETMKVLGKILVSCDEEMYPVGKTVHFSLWTPMEYHLHQTMFNGENPVNVETQYVNCLIDDDEIKFPITPFGTRKEI